MTLQLSLQKAARSLRDGGSEPSSGKPSRSESTGAVSSSRKAVVPIVYAHACRDT